MRVKILAAIVGLVALSLTGCAAVEQPSPEVAQEESRPKTQPIDPLATKEPVEPAGRTAGEEAYLNAVMPGLEALGEARTPQGESRLLEYGHDICENWSLTNISRDKAVELTELGVKAEVEAEAEMPPEAVDYFVGTIQMVSDHLCPVG